MIKLHLGCGWRNFGNDWIHIDGGDYSHLDYKDITKLEYANNTVDLIYASHVIEYFDRVEVIELLKEWKRVLKPDGTIRIAVPDFEALLQIYKEHQNLNCILGPLFGRMKMGESSIYHKTVYDFKSLQDVLQEVGFVYIKRYDWRKTEHAKFDDHSQAYYPHMDKENGLLLSLNVEATK